LSLSCVAIIVFSEGKEVVIVFSIVVICSYDLPYLPSDHSVFYTK
jgi:hypothetical protein